MSKSDPSASKKENRRYIRWVITIFLVTILISGLISLGSEELMANSNMAVAFLILLVIVLVGILFDIIGMAVASAAETSFHSKSAQGLVGSKESLVLIRNAEKVSNFCNDVIGDIAGVVSGGLAATIVTLVCTRYSFLNSILLTLLLTGIVSALTVGGKALGKGFAISQSEAIVTKVGLLVYYIKRIISFHFKRKEKC